MFKSKCLLVKILALFETYSVFFIFLYKCSIFFFHEDGLLSFWKNKCVLFSNISSSQKPVVFEINPRFSSTVLFRHLLGFEDLKWSIEELLGDEISNFNKPKNGIEFFKGYNEYIKQ